LKNTGLSLDMAILESVGGEMATWTQLKAQGIKRCSAIFASGTQCKCRANARGSWCDKHAAVIEPIVKRAMKAVRQASVSSVMDCINEEGD